MTTEPQEQMESQETPAPISVLRRTLQYVGALLVTGFLLWFLFGIPAYLLFGMFFDQ